MRIRMSGSASGFACEKGPLRNYALANRIKYHFRHAMQIQLLQNMRPMRVDSIDTEVQQVGNFLIGPSLRDKLQNLPLPLRQKIVTILNPPFLKLPEVIVLQNPAHLGAEERLPLRNRPNRRDERSEERRVGKECRSR